MVWLWCFMSTVSSSTAATAVKVLWKFHVQKGTNVVLAKNNNGRILHAAVGATTAPGMVVAVLRKFHVRKWSNALLAKNNNGRILHAAVGATTSHQVWLQPTTSLRGLSHFFETFQKDPPILCQQYKTPLPCQSNKDKWRKNHKH